MSNSINTQILAELKGLIMDATRKANSGHPGGAMSSADFAVILFSEYLRFAPNSVKWKNRDRFVLSAGHESMLLYGLLNFLGLLDMKEIENFRQLGSLTPGHPEVHLTPGVEATTGPLGQGISMAVGMAIAEKRLKAALSAEVIDHKIYVLCSDGDLQEPVAIGSSAIAGHLGLDNLIVYYDKNDIQISGKTSRSDTTDFAKLYDSIGWNVIEIDGHDHDAIRNAIESGQNSVGKPTIIIGRTIMAKGTASMEGSHKTHGEPLKAEEISATKEKLGLDPNKQFFVSDSTYQHFADTKAVYNQEAISWEEKVNNLLSGDEDFAKFYGAAFNEIPELMAWPQYEDDTTVATRVVFGKALEYMASEMPLIMGGSADLEPSNNTAGFAALSGEFSRDNRKGGNLAFGVREFPMAAIVNGMALHGGVVPFGATFLTFSDYSRNAIRMSAIQELQVLHVFTHDSIFLGEDGPTHQSIEHVMSLRAIPNLLVFRPGDANETNVCMQIFLKETHRPSLICLTRQNLPVLGKGYADAVHTQKGAYVKYETQPGAANKIVLFAAGSELSLAIDAANELKNTVSGNIRVVSLPCWELFFEQDEAYQNEVMTYDAEIRVSVEAGVTMGWERFTGLNGINIGINTFGASAPGPVLAKHFGFTVDNIVSKVQAKLAQQQLKK